MISLDNLEVIIQQSLCGISVSKKSGLLFPSFPLISPRFTFTVPHHFPCYHRQSTHGFQPVNVIAASTARGQFAQPCGKASKRYTQLLVQIDKVVGGESPWNSDTGRIGLKFFLAGSVRLRSEINVYETLQSLQELFLRLCI